MAEETFSPHLEELWAVAAEPRGQWIAIAGRHPGGRPATITLCDPRGVVLGRLHGHDKAVTSLVADPEGFLVSGAEDGTILVWKIPQELRQGAKIVPWSGEPVQRLSAQTRINSLALLSGEEGFLVVGAVVEATPETPASGLLLVFPRKGEGYEAEPSQKLSLRAPLHVVAASRLRDVEGREQCWIAAGGENGLLMTYLRQEGGAFALWRDLTAPTAADTAEGEALWSGHSGAVRALAFHPSVERLLSSGDDGTVRFWYLRGRVSYDERAGADKQQGGVLSMVFGPEGRDAKGEPVPGRLVTSAQDGSVKLWALDTKRPPRTLNPSRRPVRALAVYRLGAEHFLAAVGDERTVTLYKFQDKGSIEEGPERVIRSELDRVNRELASPDPARRVAALKSFAEEGDPEIKPLAIHHLSSDNSPEVRLAAAEILGQRGDLEARRDLRRALKDGEPRVRLGALLALRQLEGESSLEPLEAALTVQHADLRREAVGLLPGIAEKVPDAIQKIRDLLVKCLVDNDAEVRRRALDALVVLEGEGGRARALAAGIDSGSTDIKLEAMRRAYREKVAQDEALSATLMRALESSDPDVRRLGFYVAVSRSPRLEAALSEADDRARRAYAELKQPEKEEAQTAKAAAPTPRSTRPKVGDRARVARGERVDLEGIIVFAEGEVAKLEVAGQQWEVPAADLELVAPASALEPPPSDALVEKARAQLRPEDYSPVISALATRQVESALLAARTLARLRDVRALGTLLQLTREKDSKARFDVVLALRDLGDARARERLSTMLNDEDREVRLLALDALDKLPGATPHDVARTGLASRYADIHLHALQRLLPPPGTPLDARAREILLEGLGAESSERVRTEAFLILWAAARRPETEAAGTPRRLVVERAMASPHAEVRRLGVRAAAEHAVEGWASAVLGRAVDDADVVVQREAWKCLIAEARDHARVGPLQAAVASRFAAILAWFNDSDKEKRDLAYDALWFSYPDTPEEPLRLAARSRFSAMRLRALEAARRYADETWAWELLRQGLDDNDEEVRGRAYVLLREHRGKKDPSAATVGLSSRHPDIRSLAALHLGEVGERAPEIEPLLLRALRDEAKLVRQNAYEALKLLANQGHLDIDPIRLGLESFYVDLRRYALEDIERLKSEEREKRRADLRRLLGDESPELRQLAYQILRRHAGPDDPEPLRLALTSPHRDLREPALKALKDLDTTRLSKVQDVLTAHLNDENPKLRSQAYEAIVRAYGKGQLEPIKLALASPWPELREFAARDLAEAKAATAAEALLTQAMGDSVEEVRRVAFRSALTLAVGKPPKADETPEEEANRLKSLEPEKRTALSRVLGAALRSPYWDLKLLAARQLALLRDDRSLIPMAELLLDPVEGKKPERRAQAVEILSRLEDPRAGLILQQLLDDPSRDVRLRVVDGLAASTRSGKVESLRDALARALKDNDEKVRAHAYEALSKEASIPRDFLIPLALSSKFVDLRRRAAEDVGKLEGEEAGLLQQPLAERLGDEDATVRLKALASLRRIAGENDEQVLLGALASAHWDVKLEAASALAERGDRRALGPLVDLLSDPQASQNREGCLKALSALGKLGDRRASLIVQRLLRRQDRELQIAAVRALEACCRPGEVEPLLEALRLPDETVQIAAAESLARFGDPRGMQVFAKTLQKGDANVRRQVLKSYVALGLLGLRPIIDLTGDPDETIRRDALSVITAYLYSVITKEGALGSLSEEELHDVKTRFATAEQGELRFAAARIFEVESSPVAFYDFATRQLLPSPVEQDILSALEEPELPEEEEAKLSDAQVELTPEEIKKRESERRQKRYRALIGEAEKLLRRINDSDPQVRAAAAQGLSRLAMEGGLDAFLELAERSRNALRKWLMNNLEVHFQENFGKEGFQFLLSLLDDVESVEARQKKLEKSLNLSRALDDLEKRRIEERARREFEEEVKKRHEALALFFERLEQIFNDYTLLAEEGKDPLDEILARTARSDWEEVLKGAKDSSYDGGRRMYMGVLRALSLRDPETERVEKEKEQSLKDRLQAEYDARRPEAAKALKARVAEEEKEALSRGGRFLLLLLAMLFRLREEREKARDRERAAYLLAALTHSDPRVRQHAIEPLAQRQTRESFRAAADAFIKRIKPKTPEEKEKEQKKLAPTEILPELNPLGWPELQGTILEAEVFRTFSEERYLILWSKGRERAVESVRFDTKITIVRARYGNTPERLAEIEPAARPEEAKEQPDAAMWRQLAFGTYVGLMRPAGDSKPDRVREAAARRISGMARTGQIPVELAAPPLHHALADPVARVRRAALEALEELYQNPLRALAAGLASDHPDMGLYSLSRLRRHGMRLARAEGERSRRWVVSNETERKGARDLVISALDSPHSRVRRRAQEMLGEFYPEGSLEPIQHQLQASRADVRERVLASLLARTPKDEKQHEEVVAALALALSSPHEELRLDAASALAKRRPLSDEVSEKVLSVLSALLGSHSEATQRRSAQALAALSRVEAVRALSARIENDPAKTAAMAPLMEAIEKLARGGKLAGEEQKELREAAEKPLLRELDSNGEIRRKRAYAALLAISGRPALPDQPGELREKDAGVHNRTLALRYLSAAARTRFDDVRLDAINRLHQLRDEGADQVLAELLSSPSDAVREHALRALGERWIRGGSPTLLLEALATPSALEGVNATKVAIAALLSSPAEWAKKHSLPAPKEVRWKAEEHERIFETLAVAGLNAPSFEVRAQAMRALGALGDVRALQIVRLHLPDDLRVYEQPLAQALENKRLSVLRGVAAEASGELLGREGADAKVQLEIQRRLVILLRDPAPDARGPAFFTLGKHLDDRVLPLLEAALLSPRTRRLEPLPLRFTSTEGEAFEITLSHDELFAMRSVAARAVAARRWNAEHIRERLALLMADSDASVRRAASESLVALVGEDNEEYLLAAYKSPYDDLRKPAIRGLIDAGRPSTAMKLLGERKDGDAELFLRLLHRDAALLAQEASSVLSDQSAPFSQGAVAAQVLGALSAEASSASWQGTAEEALFAAMTRSAEIWLEASRTVERPGMQESERKAAKERLEGASVLFENAARAFTALAKAAPKTNPRLATGAARWLLLEGPRGGAPARDAALQALKVSRISQEDAAWPEVKKALDLCLGSVEPELRRLAADALATLAPKAALAPQPGDAIAAGGLVTAYLRSVPVSDARTPLLARYNEPDGIAAVVPALLRTQDAETLLAFLKETRGRGVRDPERDTDRSSKALHRRRLAAVHALARPELATHPAVFSTLNEIAKDRVEPNDLRRASALAVRRLRRHNKKREAEATS